MEKAQPGTKHSLAPSSFHTQQDMPLFLFFVQGGELRERLHGRTHSDQPFIALIALNSSKFLCLKQFEVAIYTHHT